EHPGRLSDALQPAGFEALAGITPKAQIPKAPIDRDDHDEMERRPAPRPPAADMRPASGHGGAKTPAVHPSRDTQSERARQRQEAAEARRQAAEEEKRQIEKRRRQA